MKLRLLLILFLGVFYGKTFGQLSPNTVNFKLTFENGEYTVWVVPNYNTPNQNNPDGFETLYSAVVDIAVPKDVNIISVIDINGNYAKLRSLDWIKWGPDYQNSMFSSLPFGTAYYTIGFFNYISYNPLTIGKFVAGTPVPLFKFKTDICEGIVKIAEANDAFQQAALQNSLNLVNSFYSKSNNLSGPTFQPLEQYIATVPGGANCVPIWVASDSTNLQVGDLLQNFNILSNDYNNITPASLQNVNLSITKQPSQGSVTINTDGTINYVLNNNNPIIGKDCFTYQLCDKSNPLICSSAVDCINIFGLVSAKPDTVVTNPNTNVNLKVLHNDIYYKQTANATNVDISIVSQPQNGTTNVLSDGTVNYVPNNNFQGTDCFAYKICAKGLNSPCSITNSCVIVGCNPIVANKDSFQVYTPSRVSLNILENDRINQKTVNRNNVVVTLLSKPVNGSVYLIDDGTVLYRIDSYSSFVDTFSYKICDKYVPSCCSKNQCTINIKNNSVLVLKMDSVRTSPNTCTTINVLANDTFEGQLLDNSKFNVYLNSKNSQYGATISVNPDRTVSYCPKTGFTGTDMYVYQMCSLDYPGICTSMTNYVSVSDVGCSTIIAQTDNLIAKGDGANYMVNVLTNDSINGVAVTSNDVSINIVKNPTYGKVSAYWNGLISYTSTNKSSLVDTFSYTICDNLMPNCCKQANVIVNLNGLVANWDSSSTFINTCKDISVLINDTYNQTLASLSNVDLTVPFNTTREGGTISINIDGTIKYCPPNNFTGIDYFNYTICDRYNYSNCSMVLDKVIVNPINSCNLSANGDNYITLPLVSTKLNILNNDSLNHVVANANNVIVSIDYFAGRDSITVNSDGTINYFSNETMGYDDIVIYKICDKLNPSCCVKATVNVKVDGTYLPIVLTKDTTSLSLNSCKSASLLNNDSLNGLAANISNVIISLPTLVTQKGNGISLNPDGTIEICSKNNYTGIDTYTYKVCQLNLWMNCQSMTNVINIQSTNSNNSTDLSIQKTVNNTTAQIGDYLTYSITVINNGSISANNIIVGDTLSKKLELISSTTYGIYNYATSTWTIPSLSAGASTTLSITAKVLGDGVINNNAAIYSLNEIDANVNNNTSSVCTSVPILICQGQNLVLNVANIYNNVQWYKNGTLYGSGNVISVSTTGNYTWTASNNNCPASGCCPIMVQSQVCCANPVCVPVTTTRN